MTIRIAVDVRVESVHNNQNKPYLFVCRYLNMCEQASRSPRYATEVSRPKPARLIVQTSMPTDYLSFPSLPPPPFTGLSSVNSACQRLSHPVFFSADLAGDFAGLFALLPPAAIGSKCRCSDRTDLLGDILRCSALAGDRLRDCGRGLVDCLKFVRLAVATTGRRGDRCAPDRLP